LWRDLTGDLFPETGDETCWRPQIDVKRQDGHYELSAEFPGMGEEDVHVDVKDGVLTLSGDKKRVVEEEKDGYRYTERSYGSFKRSFRLPPGTPAEDIHAGLDKGVLTITIPVVEEKSKRIEVKTS